MNILLPSGSKQSLDAHIEQGISFIYKCGYIEVDKIAIVFCSSGTRATERSPCFGALKDRWKQDKPKP